jgi:hypothetical protein
MYVGVVCPGTQRDVDQGSDTTPGLAAEDYAAVKAAKFADQDNFIRRPRCRVGAVVYRAVF